jgi:hypothetical protein
MITFEVVKDSHGWAVRRDNSMMMPASCRAAALAAAEQMVSALSRHGQAAKIEVTGAVSRP